MSLGFSSWLCFVAGAGVYAFGHAVISRLKEIRPDIYEELGRPSLLSWDYLSVMFLLSPHRYRSLDLTTRRLAIGHFLSFLMLVLFLMAAILRANSA